MATSIFFIFLILTAAFGGKNHDLKSHVHGQAQANIVQEARKFLIEVKLPAMEVVGFESASRAKKEQAKINKAKQKLSLSQNIVEFPGEAKCEVVSQKTNFEADGNHAEFKVEYAFECASPKKVSELRFSLFETYNKIRKLQLNYVSEQEQTSKVLTKSRNKLKIARPD